MTTAIPSELLNEPVTSLRVHPFHFYDNERCPASVTAYGITDGGGDKAVIRIVFNDIQKSEHWTVKKIRTGEAIAKIWLDDFDRLKAYSHDLTGLPGNVWFHLSDSEKNVLEITIWKSTYMSIDTDVSRMNLPLNGIMLVDKVLLFVVFHLSLSQIARYKFTVDHDFDIPIMRDDPYTEDYDEAGEEFRVAPIIRMGRTWESPSPTSILIGVEFQLHRSDSGTSSIVKHFRSYAVKAPIQTESGKLCLGIHPTASVMTFWTSVYGEHPALSCHPTLRKFLTDPVSLVDLGDTMDLFSDVIRREIDKDKWYNLLYTPPFPVFLDDESLVPTPGFQRVLR